MLNIVIPMAGRGSRFSNAGYTTPKPLIPVHGKPMIQVVIENLRPTCEHKFIFICQNDHMQKYQLESLLSSLTAEPVIIGIDGITEGQACSVLLAKKWINNEMPLLTANSDQYIDASIDDYLAAMKERSLDGLIMTMKADSPKWSYARTDAQGLVVEVAEKKVISHDATVGIFGFAHGDDFVAAAERMMADDMRVNGEFYTAPCYNYLVRSGKRIGIYGIGSEGDGMYGLGIPEDLTTFLAHPISQKVHHENSCA